VNEWSAKVELLRWRQVPSQDHRFEKLPAEENYQLYCRCHAQSQTSVKDLSRRATPQNDSDQPP